MSDVLIRDVPEDVVAAIDARAAALRLSRNEYLRRRLRQDVNSVRRRSQSRIFNGCRPCSATWLIQK